MAVPRYRRREGVAQLRISDAEQASGHLSIGTPTGVPDVVKNNVLFDGVLRPHYVPLPSEGLATLQVQANDLYASNNLSSIVTTTVAVLDEDVVELIDMSTRWHYATDLRVGHGRQLDLIGCDFQRVTQVKISNVQQSVLVESFDFRSDNAIILTLPALAVGAYDVTVIADYDEHSLSAALTIKADAAAKAQYVIEDYDTDGDLPGDATKALVSACKAAASSGGGIVTGSATSYVFGDAASVYYANFGVYDVGLELQEGVDLRFSSDTTITFSDSVCAQVNHALRVIKNSVVENVSFARETPTVINSVAAELGVSYFSSQSAPVSDITLANVKVQDGFDKAVESSGENLSEIGLFNCELSGDTRAVDFGAQLPSQQTKPLVIKQVTIKDNTIYPGTFQDTANGQGTIAMEFAAGEGMIFHNNNLDGGRKKGFRAGIFFHQGGRIRGVTFADNIVTNSGFCAGDGESIAVDINGNAYAYTSVEIPAISTTANTLATIGTLQRSDIEWYSTFGFVVTKGTGRGQYGQMVSASAQTDPTWVLDRELDTHLDSTSRIVVCRLAECVFSNGNTSNTSTAIVDTNPRQVSGALTFACFGARLRSVGDVFQDTDGILCIGQHTENTSSASHILCDVRIRETVINGAHRDHGVGDHIGAIALWYGSSTNTTPATPCMYNVQIGETNITLSGTQRGIVVDATTWDNGAGYIQGLTTIKNTIAAPSGQHLEIDTASAVSNYISELNAFS